MNQTRVILGAFEKVPQCKEYRDRSPGVVNSFAAVAYHFCLILPTAFTQPGDHILAKLCTPLLMVKRMQRDAARWQAQRLIQFGSHHATYCPPHHQYR